MKEIKIRDIALVPVESRTDQEKRLYKVYAHARDCITGSMVDLYESLDMSNAEFYRCLDTDVEFRQAIYQGLSDARSGRLLELESALIRLALGAKVKEKRDGVDADGKELTMTTIKELAPNLQALKMLLDRYKGSTWNMSQTVTQESDATLREIDYSVLSKEQLKQLAKNEK